MRARSIGPLALGLLFVAFATSVASAKPKIAILGLEVIGSLDPEQVKVAKHLTNALRERAGAGTGPFELAPNSDKELVDEKLMNNCGNEALVCMAPIGRALKADYLMWGKIEKVGKGFHVTIELIRVATKTPQPTFTEIVPVAEIKNDPKGLAKRAYAKMTAADEGTVTVRVANSERAVVYVDDEPVGTTSSGVLTFNVSEGKHRLAVVANEKGWKRHEEELSIVAGDQRNIPVELVRAGKPDLTPKPKDPPPTGDGPGASGPGSPQGGGVTGSGGGVTGSGGSVTGSGGDGGGGNGWRKLAITTTVLTGVAAVTYGASLYFLMTASSTDRGFDFRCGDVASEADNFGCKHGNELLVTSYAAGIGGAVLAGVSVVAFLKSSGAKERAVTSGRSAKARRELTVTPVVSAQGGGATLRFDW